MSDQIYNVTDGPTWNNPVPLVLNTFNRRDHAGGAAYADSQGQNIARNESMARMPMEGSLAFNATLNAPYGSHAHFNSYSTAQPVAILTTREQAERHNEVPVELRDIARYTTSGSLAPDVINWIVGAQLPEVVKEAVTWWVERIPGIKLDPRLNTDAQSDRKLLLEFLIPEELDFDDAYSKLVEFDTTWGYDQEEDFQTQVLVLLV